MNINEALEKFKLKSSQKEKILIGFLVGIFFLIIAMPSQGGTKKSNDLKLEKGKTEKQQSKQTDFDDWNAYIEKQENKLEKTIRRMEGVGEVSVMITLKNNGEKSLDKNMIYESSKESQQENNVVRDEMKNSPETVLIEQGGDTSPIVIRQSYPEVEGVFIVCQGGNDSDTVLHIKEAVQALFSIDVNKIVVCQSK